MQSTGNAPYTKSFQGGSESRSGIACSGDEKLRLIPIDQLQNKHNTDARSQLLAQNCLIISMLSKLEKKLCELFQQCREELIIVQRHIADHEKGVCHCKETGETNDSLEYSHGILKLFRSFKNADTVKKKENHELNLIYLDHSQRKWTHYHRGKLEEVIVATEIENKIKEVNEEVTNLLKSLEVTEEPEMKLKLERKLRECKSSNEIFKMSPVDLCSDLGTEYDWDSISRHISKNQVFKAEECRAMWHFYLHPKIKKTRWTQKEDARLEEVADKHDYQDWNSIAKELGTGRTSLQCIVQCFSRIHAQPFAEGTWSKEENKALTTLVSHLRDGLKMPWSAIATHVPGRSKKQVWDHWTYALDPSLKKGTFTKEEDMLLVAMVRKYGKKFGRAAQMFHGRTSAQLRHRYTILERPKPKRPWKPQDDALLLHLVKKYGEGQWKNISDHFLHYDRVQVRHHYKVLKKNKVAAGESTEGGFSDDCLSEEKLLEESYKLAYVTRNMETRQKLVKIFLPNSKQVRKCDDVSTFNRDCYSYFGSMYLNPYPKEMTTSYTNEEVEDKLHWLLCVLHIVHATLLIPSYLDAGHYLLSGTDRQIIALLRDRPTPAVSVCPKLYMPLNHTTLIGYQCLNSHCERLQGQVEHVEMSDNEEKAGSAFEAASRLLRQRLTTLFFWPILASEVEPDFIPEGESDAEQPAVCKKVPPSRVKKRRCPWLKKDKTADVQPQKRKYVKSGKYKKEPKSEPIQVRRSARNVSSPGHSTIEKQPLND